MTASGYGRKLFRGGGGCVGRSGDGLGLVVLGLLVLLGLVVLLDLVRIVHTSVGGGGRLSDCEQWRTQRSSFRCITSIDGERRSID